MTKRITAGLAILLLFCSATAIAIKPDRKYRFYPEHLGLIYRDLDVTTPDKLKIKTWLYPAQDSLSSKEKEQAWENPTKRTYKLLDKRKRPTIIICNGDAANMSWMQYALAGSYIANGYNVVTFDWRGFGESDEWKMNEDYMVYTEFLTDYKSVIEMVKKQPEVDPTRIALMGWSTGAYLSMAAASQDSDIKCFVGQALMTSFDEVMPIIRALPKNKNRQLIVPADYTKELNPIMLAPRFKRPTLLIVGEKDERTPVEMSKSILAMLPGEKEIWIVPKAEHGGANGPMQNFEVYNKKVLEFLNKYL